MDLSGLTSVTTPAEMLTWLAVNCQTPIDPVMTGTDFGAIMQKIITVLNAGGGDASYNNLTVEGTVTGLSGNLGGEDLSSFYGYTGGTGKLLVGSNRSGSQRETAFITVTGNSSRPFQDPPDLGTGGYTFSIIRDDGTETVMFSLSGHNYAALFAGAVAPGTIDPWNSPATVYLSRDPANNAIVSRTTAQLAEDIGTAVVLFNTQFASYTLGGSDRAVAIDNASANNVIVPANASAAFPVGVQIRVLQSGAGQTTIVPDTGVTINSPDGNRKLRTQFCSATLIKTNTDTWLLNGDLVA